VATPEHKRRVAPSILNSSSPYISMHFNGDLRTTQVKCGWCNPTKKSHIITLVQLSRKDITKPRTTKVRVAFKKFTDQQLIKGHIHHCLSLSNVVSCNWNALGTVYLQSKDSFLEEFLILLFKPAICWGEDLCEMSVLSWMSSV